MPDPPPGDPVLYGQPEAKKQKTIKPDDIGQSFTILHNRPEDKSEDDWEEVDGSEGGPPSIERLDDEPVQVDKVPSAVDVQSVQSSSSVADLEDEFRSPDNFLGKDW